MLQDSLKKDEVVLAKNTPYTTFVLAPDGSHRIAQEITLTHDLVYRKKYVSRLNKDLPRYTVIGERLANGASCEVFDVVGTLALSADGIIKFKSDKSRIIKIQKHVKQKTLNSAIKEANLSVSVPYLHAKDLTIFTLGPNGYVIKKNKLGLYSREETINKKSYFVEKKFVGEKLEDIIKSDNDGSKVIPLEKRLSISYHLLEALSDLHMCGVIHNDLKPENILVDIATGWVKIIDLNLSSKMGEANTCCTPGNLAYMAPEGISGKYAYDHLSDIYSMGLILAELWHAKSRESSPVNTPEHVKEMLKREKEVARFNNMFFGIKGLNEGQKRSLMDIIRSMCQLHPEKRPSLSLAAKVIDIEILKLKSASLNAECKQELHNTYYVAREARNELNQLAIISKLLPTYKEISRIIYKTLDSIEDNPLSISCFKEVIQVELFKDATSKQDIKLRLKNAIDIFKNNWGELLRLRSYADCMIKKTPLVQQFIEDIVVQMDKYDKHIAALEDIEIFNSRMTEQIKVLNKTKQSDALRSNLSKWFIFKIEIGSKKIEIIKDYKPLSYN